MCLEHREFDLSPAGLTQILTEYGMAIEQGREYDRIQNGTIVKMAERMQRMEDKLDNVVTQVSSTDTKLLEWKDELKDSIKEAIEKNNDKRDLNIRQRITWIISLFIGIPSTLWAFFQLINFLAKR